MKSFSRSAAERAVPIWAALVLWLVAFAAMFFMGIVIAQRTPVIRGSVDQAERSAEIGAGYQERVESNASLPSQIPPYTPDSDQSIRRSSILITDKPESAATEATKYTIAAGDSIYSIASRFNLEPETILWSNYDVLHDDAHNISIGDELIIPPSDGIYYLWKENDVLQRVADKYHVDPKAILLDPANKLDITSPAIKAGEYVMLPGGYRATAVISPVVFEYSKDSGVKKKISGPGGCDWDYAGYGNGSFVWPSATHSVSGNDFWSGHMGLDIATVLGGPIYAADGGTVIYSGPISGGYGIMIMIDHGNGYQTLYAHLSSVSVSCGQGVSQGQVIGAGGSTGNSTGPHLHFEVRYGGGYVNPWNVL